MPHNVVVMYPTADDAKFDMSYYLKTHMPLVMKKWGPFGLKEWKVSQFANHPASGETPPYNVLAYLIWESEDGLKKALDSKDSAEVFGDVPNFSNKGPVFMAGGVTGTSSDRLEKL